MKPNKHQADREGWEVEFDRKFADTQFSPSYHTHYFNEAGIYPQVKDFIRQTLTTYSQRVRGIIELQQCDRYFKDNSKQATIERLLQALNALNTEYGVKEEA